MSAPLAKLAQAIKAFDIQVEMQMPVSIFLIKCDGVYADMEEMGVKRDWDAACSSNPFICTRVPCQPCLDFKAKQRL